MLLRADVHHRYGGQDGLPQAFVVPEVRQQRTRGGQFGDGFGAAMHLQGKDERILLTAFQAGAHPAAPLGHPASAAFPVPGDAEAPAALQLLADGGKALGERLVRVALQTHHARARDRAVHKPRLRAPVVEGLRAGQGVDERRGGPPHRDKGVRHAPPPVLSRQLAQQVVAPLAQRHAAVGGRVPRNGAFALGHGQVLAQRKLRPCVVPHPYGQAARAGRLKRERRLLQRPKRPGRKQRKLRGPRAAEKQRREKQQSENRLFHPKTPVS